MVQAGAGCIILVNFLDEETNLEIAGKEYLLKGKEWKVIKNKNK